MAVLLVIPVTGASAGFSGVQFPFALAESVEVVAAPVFGSMTGFDAASFSGM